MTTFKKGDTVRCVLSGDSPFMRGHTYTVTDVHQDGTDIRVSGDPRFWSVGRFALWQEPVQPPLPGVSRRVLGLTGLKQSGKDTAAKALTERGYEKVQFAGPLKAMLAALLAYRGADEETIERMLEGDLKEVPTRLLNGRTPRYAMQTLGTEWGREIMADNIWVDAARDRIRQFDKVVVTDVRFLNEAAMIRQEGGAVVRVERQGQVRESNHPSEVEISTMAVDAVLRNDAPSAAVFTARVAALLG